MTAEDKLVDMSDTRPKASYRWCLYSWLAFFFGLPPAVCSGNAVAEAIRTAMSISGWAFAGIALSIGVVGMTTTKCGRVRFLWPVLISLAGPTVFVLVFNWMRRN